MKTIRSTLLIGALALFAPALSAQRGTYGRITATSYTRGYESSRVWIPGHFENVSQRVRSPNFSRFARKPSNSGSTTGSGR